MLKAVFGTNAHTRLEKNRELEKIVGQLNSLGEEADITAQMFTGRPRVSLTLDDALEQISSGDENVVVKARKVGDA